MRAFLRQFVALGLPVLLNAQSSSCENSSQAVALVQLGVSISRATVSNAVISANSTDGIIDKVVFIKLHAVGSSTFAAILHRYCEFHDKNCFVYPKDMHIGKTLTDEDLRGIVTSFQSGEFPALDIWPNHVNMRTEMLNTLIPGNFKIGLFRTPLPRMMSAFRHHYPTERVKDTMEALKRDQHIDDCGGRSGRLMSSQISPNQVEELDFVMLTEYYDWSLMMLRQKLGWSMFDMMYRSLKDEHPADMVAVSAAFEEYLSQPLGALNNATQVFLQDCTGGNESLVYMNANRTFYQQWESLSLMEQQQVENDEALFVAARNLLEQCCDSNPSDSYCVGLLEDNVDWNQRYQADNRPYASMQLHRASISSSITHTSLCMLLVQTTLRSGLTA